MAIAFRAVTHAPLSDFTVEAPGSAIIGIIGEKGAGKSALMRLAAGLDQPVSGKIAFTGTHRYIGARDALNFSPVDLLLLEHSLSQSDALVRARAAVSLDRVRKSGTTVLFVSHEAPLLRLVCDEVWWLDAGRLVAQGDPGEVLEEYQKNIAGKFRAWGETLSSPIAPVMRKGDGRACVLALETLGESGKPAMVLRSGEAVTIRVKIRYDEPVDDPVVGIMIRTRVGLEVYGTNTGLEKLKLGPCVLGDVITVEFRFRCDLCPKEYTLTAASHDPDGTAHDWVDDAVAFVVADSRYTAGVANLKAEVTYAR